MKKITKLILSQKISIAIYNRIFLQSIKMKINNFLILNNAMKTLTKAQYEIYLII